MKNNLIKRVNRHLSRGGHLMKSTGTIKSFTLIMLFSLTALYFGGCAKTRKAGGHMDTPETHYKQGMKYWDQGVYDKAEEEFKLALSLDPKFAPANAGLALTTAKTAQNATDLEQAKDLFKKAHKLADKAKGDGKKIPQPYIAKAMVITMEHEGTPPKKWLKDVEKEYEDAIKIDPDFSETYYRRGVCYKKAYEFRDAGNDFKKVLDLNDPYTKEADVQWQLVQKIERAAPGTDIGKKIALVDQISRADIAALFVSELKIDQLVKKRRPVAQETGFKAPDDPRTMETETSQPVAQATDIDEHWAKNFITDIITLDIRGLEPYPDHTFHPNDLINRGEYAMMVEDILISITGDESLASKHIGSESRFPDVNPSHPSYNAICNAVDKNIMDAEMNGTFKPTKSVSGPDALLIIRKIKEFNKI